MVNLREMVGTHRGEKKYASFVIKINEPFDTFSVKIYTSKSIQKKTFYLTRKKGKKSTKNNFCHNVSSDIWFFLLPVVFI